jgi:hypothetical protein
MGWKVTEHYPSAEELYAKMPHHVVIDDCMGIGTWIETELLRRYPDEYKGENPSAWHHWIEGYPVPGTNGDQWKFGIRDADLAVFFKLVFGGRQG